MLRISPIELEDARRFVRKHHRHNPKTGGHRFSIAAWDGERLVGVAVCGRPKARSLNPLEWLEVTRCCTDGTKNACSFLYGAAARAAKAMGFRYIQTYTRQEEDGASLRAVGWTPAPASSGGAQWGLSRQQAQLFPDLQEARVPKIRWTRSLCSGDGAAPGASPGDPDVQLRRLQDPSSKPENAIQGAQSSSPGNTTSATDQAVSAVVRGCYTLTDGMDHGAASCG